MLSGPIAGTQGPPLDPSSEQAREWLREELSSGGYTTEPSPWQRFVEWLRDALSPDVAVGGGLPGWVLPLVVAVVLVLAALVVARLVRPEARARRRGADDGVGLDPRVTSADYRRRAESALGSGDADSALLDAFRALTARAVERTLLGDLPGRTAHEVAATLAPVFPSHATDLAVAANAFDAVRYGRQPTTEATARTVLALDTALASARPTLPELVPTPGGAR